MKRTLLQDRRVWLAGGALAAVIIAAASWFLVISPKLSSADDLDIANADVQTQNVLVGAKNAKLANQNRGIGTLRSKLVRSLAGLPPKSGLPDFTREVTSLAQGNHVTLTNIAITAPTAPTAPTAVATSAPTDGSASASSGAPTSSASSSPSVASAGSVLTISVILSSTGTMPHQTAFLKDLQDGPRRVLVTTTQLSFANASRVNSVSASTTMTTQATIFTAPLSADQVKSIQQALRGN